MPAALKFGALFTTLSASAINISGSVLLILATAF
jgi:hypothetical protein